jgi:hypothetical protein
MRISVNDADGDGTGLEVDPADPNRRGAEVDGDDGKPLHESLS